MKFRTTQKYIKGLFKDVIVIPYCDAYYLLKNENAIAYTAGVYGWNADIYNINGVAVVTGYRPFGNIQNRELVREYNERAKNEYDRDKLTALLNEFITKATEDEAE